jgi:exodeoxyribonuclease V alpha subunit
MTKTIPLKPGQEIAVGVLERIIFYNEETKYCIGQLRQEESKNIITIVGFLPGIQCGETLSLTGKWETHSTHGKQFRLQSFHTTLPASVYGIRKYLGSKLISGIGKAYADKIVDKFGTDTLKVISEDSGRLREIPGLGKKRIQKIKQYWQEQQNTREVIIFLQTYGISIAQCLRLIKKYGDTTCETIRNNPYKVVNEIDGIGFKTADKIAINIGLPNESPQRIDAGILYMLKTLEGEGHTGCPLETLPEDAARLLKVDKTKVAEHLQILVNNQTISLTQGNHLLQLPAAFYAEQKIAQGIQRILSTPSSLPLIKVEKAIQWTQEQAGFNFASEQIQAIRESLTKKISIITGGPGTGKTTILYSLVKILKIKKVKFVLAAPTGRAAQRMAETTGAFAQTLHRLLKFDPIEKRFMINEETPLPYDYIVIDEASMLDIYLASSLLQAISGRIHLLLVGDANQLPSVGPGNVLKDLIDCDCIKVTRLEKIYRQKEQSSIVATAHAILKGYPNPLPGTMTNINQLNSNKDQQFIYATSPEQCVENIKTLCCDFIPRNYSFDPLMDVQVLAPMHRGIAGITNINKILQKTMNPQKNALQSNNFLFQENDKIIQTRNNYEKNIFNGDIGKVTAINKKDYTLKAIFNTNEVTFEQHELSDLQPAYTTSVHKAQGSEFPIVIIALLKGHFIMLQRNLIYTAITRGKEKVFIVGDPAAYARAVKNKDNITRQTNLKYKIQNYERV